LTPASIKELLTRTFLPDTLRNKNNGNLHLLKIYSESFCRYGQINILRVVMCVDTKPVVNDADWRRHVQPRVKEPRVKPHAKWQLKC